MLLVLLIAVGAFAQDNPKIRERFQKEWGQKDLDRRKNAIKQLGTDNCAAAAKLLLDTCSDLVKDHARLLKDKGALLGDIGRIPTCRCVDEQGRVLDATSFKKRSDLNVQIKATEQLILENEAFLETARDAMANMTASEALQTLADRFQHPNGKELRRLLANAFAKMKDEATRKALVEQLDHEHPGDVLCAIVDALRDRKESALWKKLLDGYDKTPFWQVKVSILRAQLEFDTLDAVDPLIALIEKSDARLKWEINDVLVSLTGTNKHGDASAWKSWWEESRKDFAVVRPSKDKRMDALKSGRSFFDQAYGIAFYDIAVRSKRVTFLIDLSGSMRDKPELVQRDADRDKSKIEIVQGEMNRVIRSLPNDAEFNIIFYNDDVAMFSSKGLIAANEKNKEKATKFVESIQPFGGTNLFDALEAAFRPADFGKPEDCFKMQTDTLVLLTDGVPNMGSITERSIITEKIRRMNRESKLVVHTVLVGTNRFSEEFLKEISSASDGVFVQR